MTPSKRYIARATVEKKSPGAKGNRGFWVLWFGWYPGRHTSVQAALVWHGVYCCSPTATDSIKSP